MHAFRKKPVVIEAIEYTGAGNFANPRLPHWMWAALESRMAFNRGGELVIKTLEGEMTAAPGDWIIRGIKGELYPCKPDIFASTYERASPVLDGSSFTGLTFGDALVALKGGATVARAGWNGSGQWIALGKGSDYLAASQFWNQHARAHAEQNGGGAAVRPYFILKTAQNDILMGWSPSQSDALAEDWLIVSGEVGAAHVSA